MRIFASVMLHRMPSTEFNWKIAKRKASTTGKKMKRRLSILAQKKKTKRKKDSFIWQCIHLHFIIGRWEGDGMRCVNTQSTFHLIHFTHCSIKNGILFSFSLLCLFNIELNYQINWSLSLSLLYLHTSVWFFCGLKQTNKKRMDLIWLCKKSINEKLKKWCLFFSSFRKNAWKSFGVR